MKFISRKCLTPLVYSQVDEHLKTSFGISSNSFYLNWPEALGPSLEKGLQFEDIRDLVVTNNYDPRYIPVIDFLEENYTICLT